MIGPITIDGENTTVILEASRDMAAIYPNLRPFPIGCAKWVKEVYKAFQTIENILKKGIELEKVELFLTPSGIDQEGCISIDLFLVKDDKRMKKPYVLKFDNKGNFEHPQPKKKD